MKTTTKTRLAGAALVLFVLLYPFSVTVAPEWTVKVLDENGEPLAGAYVSEGASQWTLGFGETCFSSARS
jgi:hypothetical protein